MKQFYKLALFFWLIFLGLHFEAAAKNGGSLSAIIDLAELAPDLELAQNRMLSYENIHDILWALIKEGKIYFAQDLNSLDKVQQCTKIKTLGDEAKGVFSGQLFAISYNVNCSLDQAEKWQAVYILKETKKGKKEINHLEKVSHSPLIQEKISTMDLLSCKENGCRLKQAVISFEDAHFKFESHNKTHYFSLLQTAFGQSLHSHLEHLGQEFSANKNYDFQYEKDMFFRLGYAVSKLHQSFADNKSQKSLMGTTFIHGDFHAQNIFYDPITQNITLIDNETFALSLKKKSSGINDIVDLYLLHSTKTIAHRVAHSLKTNQELGIDDELWHELWQHLIIGYVSAFEDCNLEERQIIFHEVKTRFKLGLSNWWTVRSIYQWPDQRMLKRVGPSLRRFYLRKYAVNRMFNEAQIKLKDLNLL